MPTQASSETGYKSSPLNDEEIQGAVQMLREAEQEAFSPFMFLFNNFEDTETFMDEIDKRGDFM